MINTSKAPRDTKSLFTANDLISVYTRAQAIEDGVLIDVSDMAKQAGFKFPVAVTASLQAVLNDFSNGSGQSYNGRLWDVLNMARFYGKVSRTDRVRFPVIIKCKSTRQKKFFPVAVCSPGDDFDPVITIGFPEDF